MTDTPSGSELATLVSRTAHELRNHVATIRSVVQLVDEPEVALALRDAISAVQRANERYVALSRVLLDEHPDHVDLAIGDLLDLARQRAHREGASALPEPGAVTTDAVVNVPGTWAERLLADLLHVADGAPPRVEVGDSACVVDVRLASELDESLRAAFELIAAACGGSFAIVADRARVRLPLSAG